MYWIRNGEALRLSIVQSKNPKLSLGDWNIKLDLNAESTTNWRILQTAIEYLDQCHTEGKKINPKKKFCSAFLFQTDPWKTVETQRIRENTKYSSGKTLSKQIYVEI